jgi:hypothetical protein
MGNAARAQSGSVLVKSAQPEGATVVLYNVWRWSGAPNHREGALDRHTVGAGQPAFLEPSASLSVGSGASIEGSSRASRIKAGVARALGQDQYITHRSLLGRCGICLPLLPPAAPRHVVVPTVVCPSRLLPKTVKPTSLPLRVDFKDLLTFFKRDAESQHAMG